MALAEIRVGETVEDHRASVGQAVQPLGQFGIGDEARLLVEPDDQQRGFLVGGRIDPAVGTDVEAEGVGDGGIDAGLKQPDVIERMGGRHELIDVGGDGNVEIEIIVEQSHFLPGSVQKGKLQKNQQNRKRDAAQSG